MKTPQENAQKQSCQKGNFVLNAVFGYGHMPKITKFGVNFLDLVITAGIGKINQEFGKGIKGGHGGLPFKKRLE